MITQTKTEDYLDKVLKLIELTQQGSLSWSSESFAGKMYPVLLPPAPEFVKRMSELTGLHEEAAVEYFNRLYYRIVDEVLNTLAFKTEFEGKVLRLYREPSTEGGLRRRAKLDVKDASGLTIDTYPQSAALDDLLRAVEQRLQSSQRRQ